MVDRSRRRHVIRFFEDVYEPALGVPMGWTGSVSTCTPGTVSPAYSLATRSMVNYFRAMAGLPGNVVLDADLSAKAQQSALMMIANGRLSHNPSSSWNCYTAAGDEASGKSNLALGQAGAAAIVGYMRDNGGSNTAVGHRRWILFPRQQRMGTGSTDARNGFFNGSNTLWVLSDFGGRPVTPEWTAWPPEGIVPFSLVFDRWSLSRNSVPGADFSGAAVAMRLAGKSVALRVLPVANGFGDNTLVWEVSGLAFGSGQKDKTIRVEVENVVVGGVSRRLQYEVTVIDPERSLVGTSGPGVYDPAAGRFMLTYKAVPGAPRLKFRFGPRPSQRLPVAGDWNENGRESVALYDQKKGTFALRTTNQAGPGVTTFRFGKRAAGWLPLAGNWDGRHGDSVGLYDPGASRFFLRTANQPGAGVVTMRFGLPGGGWIPIAGDWDGDGNDSVGLYDPINGRFLLKNGNRSGGADIRFRFGPRSSQWLPVVGDWDGDGTDSVGLYQPTAGRFVLKNRNRRGPPDVRFRYGPRKPDLLPIAGNWNGS
jgi:hypothetical protein